MHLDYYFERINKANISDLSYLFRQYGKDYRFDFLENKLDTSYTGVEYIGFFAYHKRTKEPAAYYGVLPYIMRSEFGQILGAQSGDTITHPSHTRKGLFLDLARLTYALAKENGIKIIFGFPNQNSKNGFFKHLDWTQESRFYSFQFSFNNFPYSKVLNKLNLKKKYSLDSDLEAIKNFVEIKYNEKGISIDLSIPYINYKRKISNSTIKFWDGYGFWFIPNNTILVGDIVGLNNQEINGFHTSLKKLCKGLGLNKLQILAKDNSPLFEYLTRTGHESRSTDLYSGYLNLCNELDLGGINTSFSDSDTF